jgi:rhodanese-related sulfurtransferase
MKQFKAFQNSKSQFLDCRPTSVFASSFIPNSINASLNGSYEYMASCIFDKEKHLVVICEEGKEAESVLRSESEGFKDISTFNFEIWEKGGGKTSAIVRYLASEAQKHVDSMKDVSNTEDWEVLHVKGPSSVPLIDLV